MELGVGGICSGGRQLGVYFDRKGPANEISRFSEGGIRVSVPGGSGECQVSNIHDQVVACKLHHVPRAELSAIPRQARGLPTQSG